MNIQSLIPFLIFSLLIFGCNYQVDQAYSEMEEILDANNAILLSSIDGKIGMMESSVKKFPYRQCKPLASAARDIQKSTLFLTNLIDDTYPIYQENSEKIREMVVKKQDEIINILNSLNNRAHGIKHEEIRNLIDELFASSEINNDKVALKKIKNDALISTIKCVDFLGSKIGHTILFWDKFIVVSEPNEVFLTKGETFETHIFASQLSKYKIYKSIKVNGEEISDVDSGVATYKAATYKTTPTQYGEHIYKVEITIENPHTGKTETLTESFKYEVGERCY